MLGDAGIVHERIELAVFRGGFRDFPAIGILANVALRDREEGDDDSETLRSLTGTGGAVVLCSYTTIIGYGSLILSDNAGIRSFGMAATAPGRC